MNLPDNHTTYVRQIKLRCKNLITHGIWEGIDPNTLELWWKNFKSEEEKYFAAGILDSLIYRSDKQVDSMIFELLSRKIPNVFERTRSFLEYELTYKLWTKSLDPKIRVTSPVFEEDPTKSGHQILRNLKRKWVRKSWIIPPNKITHETKNGVKTILVFDDFCGTGTQLNDFIEKNNLTEIIKNKTINLIFVFLCIHEKAIKKLESIHPNILLTSAELIQSDYSCFNIFDDGVNSKEIAKKFYLELLKKMGISKPHTDFIFGRGNLEIVYAFQQSIPNNSLSLLYHDSNWNPLFRR